MVFLFVGEERSQKAIDMGVRWKDGRLAAAQLFDALEACGIDPAAQRFLNLFEGELDENLRRIRRAKKRVVAMGRRVQEVLDFHGIKHLEIVHPAARGKIRRKDRYAAHLRETLTENA